MKTIQIPENAEEVPDRCPFCNKAGLHRGLSGRRPFTNPKYPGTLAVYYCGTYIWDNGQVDLGDGCIGLLPRVKP
jgi:hypothetical protein